MPPKARIFQVAIKILRSIVLLAGTERSRPARSSAISSLTAAGAAGSRKSGTLKSDTAYFSSSVALLRAGQAHGACRSTGRRTRRPSPWDSSSRLTRPRILKPGESPAPTKFFGALRCDWRPALSTRAIDANPRTGCRCPFAALGIARGPTMNDTGTSPVIVACDSAGTVVRRLSNTAR